jgi:VanZ family protein
MRNLFRTLLVLCIAAIVVLSVVPPAWRPVTRVPHDVEHFVMFALAGAALALAIPHHRLWLVAASALFAAIVEAIQLLVPGRHARISDFLVDTLGVWAGLGLGFWLDAVRARAARSRPGVDSPVEPRRRPPS